MQLHIFQIQNLITIFTTDGIISPQPYNKLYFAISTQPVRFLSGNFIYASHHNRHRGETVLIFSTYLVCTRTKTEVYRHSWNFVS